MIPIIWTVGLLTACSCWIAVCHQHDSSKAKVRKLADLLFSYSKCLHPIVKYKETNLRIQVPVLDDWIFASADQCWTNGAIDFENFQLQVFYPVIANKISSWLGFIVPYNVLKSTHLTEKWKYIVGLNTVYESFENLSVVSLILLGLFQAFMTWDIAISCIVIFFKRTHLTVSL